MSGDAAWRIEFLMPNLRIEKPIDTEYMAIVPASNARAKAVAKRSKWARHIINCFTNQFDEKVLPALLIYREDAPEAVTGIEAAAAFRNAFAVSCIVHACTDDPHTLNVLETRYSDFFDFYPITVSSKENALIQKTPAAFSIDTLGGFRGQTSAALPNCEVRPPHPDERIYVGMRHLWDRRFVQGRTGKCAPRLLFRSLEMAYHASRVPYKSSSGGPLDHGTSIGLWVSAFEVLAHPPKGNVALEDVVSLLGDAEMWNENLRTRRYVVRHRGDRLRLCAVQRAYKDLYDARNDFLHGNRLHPNRLHAFKRKQSALLTDVAPLIYRAALSAFLNRNIASRTYARLMRGTKDWQQLANETTLAEILGVNAGLTRIRVP